jgi:hypothetical protein
MALVNSLPKSFVKVPCCRSCLYVTLCKSRRTWGGWVCTAFKIDPEYTFSADHRKAIP